MSWLSQRSQWKKKKDIVISHMKHTLKCKGVDNIEVSTVILEAWLKLLLTVVWYKTDLFICIKDKLILKLSF